MKFGYKMTREEFDKAIGREITDDGILAMQREWVYKDYYDYVEATGYDVNPYDLFRFVQDFGK